MAEVVKAIVAALLSLGPLGVVVAGMGVWIWQLQKQLVQIQNQRVKDAYRVIGVAHASAAALERNTQTLNKLLEG